MSFTRLENLRELSVSIRRNTIASIIIGLAAATATAASNANADVPRPATPNVAVAAPNNATEGEKFAVTARIKKPKQALRVTFQYKETAIYDYQSITSWTTLKTVKVKHRRAVSITTQADAAKEAKFRAVVTYRGSRHTSKSSPVRVNYWHWQGLSGRYYTAGSDIDFIGFNMGGKAWNGWYQYGGPSAESRYTLSGTCKRFKATVGLTDQSADGSTGTVTFSTINPAATAQPAWSSPVLIPGKTVTVDLPLRAPYRFSIFGQNTSAPVSDGSGKTTTPAAYPAVGDPEFLCHQD